MKFEFTSLRHVVSSAEKAWIFSLKIGEKGRTFATFARRSGPEKKHQREHFRTSMADRDRVGFLEQKRSGPPNAIVVSGARSAPTCAGRARRRV
jgi:hypothetical protein